MLKACLAIAILWLCPLSRCCIGLQAHQSREEQQVREFLSKFVQAFENLDWQSFRDCFAEDATVFYPEFFPRRTEGALQLDKSWEKVFANIRTQSGKSTKPYMNLRPIDIQVQMFGQVAVVTFHLEHGCTAVGRRTLILNKRQNGWRIVHLHASNVDFGGVEN